MPSPVFSRAVHPLAAQRSIEMPAPLFPWAVQSFNAQPELATIPVDELATAVQPLIVLSTPIKIPTELPRAIQLAILLPMPALIPLPLELFNAVQSVTTQWSPASSPSVQLPETFRCSNRLLLALMATMLPLQDQSRTVPLRTVKFFWADGTTMPIAPAPGMGPIKT